MPKPPFKMRMRWGMLRLLGKTVMKFPTITDPTVGGDVIRLGRREYFIVHTPGHTEDHICLHDPVDQVFLAGDHVLPSITPHISGLSSNPDPLQGFAGVLDDTDPRPALTALCLQHDVDAHGRLPLTSNPQENGLLGHRKMRRTLENQGDLCLPTAS